MHGGIGLSARLGRISVRFLTLVAVVGAAPAMAQDFSAGKTAAQLFASDCAACHKSPGGLAKGQSVSALTSFLREHYTTKTESAAALAVYLANPANAKLPAQTPTTGPKATEDKPGAKTRPAATATAEPDKPTEAEASDPMVAKLNAYAAARGEPKDTARGAAAAKKLESYANAGSGGEGATSPKPGDKKKKDTTGATADTAAPHPPRPRRAQTPIIQPPPGNN
jgi:hypothetical protein